jgi:raffinose/stachyose/melibiose transport system substrate-binding protein
VEATDPGPVRPGRRSVLKAAALGAFAAPLLSACGAGGDGTRLRFYQSKPEVLGYFDQIIEDFHRQQSGIEVKHDATGSLVASFVRDAPFDLVCVNYNLDESGTFVGRGVLSDLAGLPEARRIDPDVQALVGQYASYHDETSVLPYSVTAAGVIYNKDLFAQHGVEVPTTWSELIRACDTFRSKAVTPIYATYQAPWTISQGLFDYVVGGTLDVAGFFARLKAQGTDVGPDSEVSFQRTFKPAVDKMLQLGAYTNPDAASRDYPDGNAAFAQGKVAMYLQGPWAIGEITKANPDVRMGTFVLPTTEDPADRKARVNIDLALWIPRGAAEPEAAKRFLSYLMTPAVMDKYNGENLAFSPVRNAPAVTDERIVDLEPYVRQARFYQGAGTSIPGIIPLTNYLQELVFTGNGDRFLGKLDDDWRRLAVRSL